ncbi:hypothetical protein J4N42_15485 [Vibrio sp. SCSIO 43135]|uniref:hypothetical protein n=1 Tax=Vibrio sp. SCSIO 43135 TaxID=2819096 RepID=UPI002075DE89|nr:hypothetical protein [Vibrio sp. SCSIO 43135]USD43578.1 hypothetical protein J4N42_15485 [Vibrio sp. SCSIO 43135]
MRRKCIQSVLKHGYISLETLSANSMRKPAKYELEHGFNPAKVPLLPINAKMELMFLLRTIDDAVLKAKGEVFSPILQHKTMAVSD